VCVCVCFQIVILVLCAESCPLFLIRFLSSNKEEMYRHLSIDIITEKDGAGKSKDTASVETSLAHFFQPEDREIKCEKCEEGTHAEQTLKILSR